MAAAVIVVALKVVGKIEKTLDIDKIIELLSEFSNLKIENIKEVSQNLLAFA